MIEVEVCSSRTFKTLEIKDNLSRWTSGFLSPEVSVEVGERVLLAAYDLMGKAQFKKFCEENDLV